MKICLISCSAKKLDYETFAENLYSASTLFKYSLEYAKLKQYDKIYILSALHGIVQLDTLLKPYNVCLNTMKINERKQWGMEISNWINDNIFDDTQIDIIAGKRYYENINTRQPINVLFKNQKLGEKLHNLKLEVSKLK